MTTSFPSGVEEALRNDLYLRLDPAEAESAFRKMGVRPGTLFREFYRTFTGGYYSNRVGRLLLDVGQGTPTVVDQTVVARKEFGLPAKFLVLTELEAGSVLVYDCEMDVVFLVDFEGSDEQLIVGTLKPDWSSFKSFLDDFF